MQSFRNRVERSTEEYTISKAITTRIKTPSSRWRAILTLIVWCSPLMVNKVLFFPLWQREGEKREKRADSESVLDVAQWTEGFQLKSSASQRNTWWIHGATAGTHSHGSSISKKVYIVLAFKFAYLIQLRRRYTMEEIRHKIKIEDNRTPIKDQRPQSKGIPRNRWKTIEWTSKT